MQLLGIILNAKHGNQISITYIHKTIIYNQRKIRCNQENKRVFAFKFPWNMLSCVKHTEASVTSDKVAENFETQTKSIKLKYDMNTFNI